MRGEALIITEPDLKLRELLRVAGRPAPGGKFGEERAEGTLNIAARRLGPGRIGAVQPGRDFRLLSGGKITAETRRNNEREADLAPLHASV